MPLAKNGTAADGTPATTQESAKAHAAPKTDTERRVRSVVKDDSPAQPVKPEPGNLPTESGLSRTAKVGAFLLSGLVLFGLGLFLIGNRDKVFSRAFDVYADFASVDGLQTGADVRVSGLQAGELVEIQVPHDPGGQYRLKLRLDEKVHPLVRQDSIATIQSDGLVGDKFLEVDKGSDNSPACPAGCTIPTMEPFDFSDLMQEGRGLLENTNTTIKSAGDVADNVNRVLEQFLAAGRNGENGPAELKATVASAQHAMSNISEDTEALKHNFLLRGFFHNRGYYDLSELTPAQYRTSKLVKGKQVRRVWLPSDQLFVKSPNGQEHLSERGRAALDNAMSDFVSDLPNRPLIVEGYSDQGPPDEQYRKSQQRAEEVQQYLEARFQLKPDLVGEIPLEKFSAGG